MEELYVVFGKISGLVCTEIFFYHPVFAFCRLKYKYKCVLVIFPPLNACIKAVCEGSESSWSKVTSLGKGTCSQVPLVQLLGKMLMPVLQKSSKSPSSSAYRASYGNLCKR